TQFGGLKMEDRGKLQLAEAEAEEDEIVRFHLEIMNGYQDTVIPPLSYFAPDFPNTQMNAICRKRQTNRASKPRPMTQRKRREEMTQKYSLLQSMLPTSDNAVKQSNEKIIGDAVSYIKYLEKEKKKLEALKKSQMEEQNMAKSFWRRCRNPSSLVEVNVPNGTKFLEIQMPFRRGSVAKIVGVLEKHKAEVLEARVNVNEQRVLTFTATIVLSCDGDCINAYLSTLHCEVSNITSAACAPHEASTDVSSFMQVFTFPVNEEVRHIEKGAMPFSIPGNVEGVRQG
ncbi:basic helix-loop-helix (bHLH) DNA-bindingsuperfamily protein, partial [Striga asiatica]